MKTTITTIAAVALLSTAAAAAPHVYFEGRAGDYNMGGFAPTARDGSALPADAKVKITNHTSCRFGTHVLFNVSNGFSNMPSIAPCRAD